MVDDAAIDGVAQRWWQLHGSDPKAALGLAGIAIKAGAELTEAAVTDHCATKLARFKRPRLVRFVDDFPKTAIGKIQKTVLKNQYWEETGRKI